MALVITLKKIRDGAAASSIAAADLTGATAKIESYQRKLIIPGATGLGRVFDLRTLAIAEVAGPAVEVQVKPFSATAAVVINTAEFVAAVAAQKRKRSVLDIAGVKYDLRSLTLAAV